MSIQRATGTLRPLDRYASKSPKGCIAAVSNTKDLYALRIGASSLYRGFTFTIDMDKREGVSRIDTPSLPPRQRFAKTGCPVWAYSIIAYGTFEHCGFTERAGHSSRSELLLPVLTTAIPVN